MPKRKSPMKFPNHEVSAASKQITDANEKRVKMWSKAKTERLIQSIEKQLVLYKVTMSDFKNNVSKLQRKGIFHQYALNMLRNCFSTGPDDVKNKWKQLKDTYRNEEKTLNEEDPSGSGLEGSKRAKKRWIYFDQMGFLSTMHDNADRDTNVDDEGEGGKRKEYLLESNISKEESANDTDEICKRHK
ncbi:hypothetical protein GHT06_019058 [Daphnia sinensis]|uniref:MADF domain-containing protein n=1 Tax=Daphnia sinensis TaxID=1820382 RepID=A0AAD5L165_9CRUS|nr:hypothetical protein GHT06_019058 [Daphnia sinensis]